MGSRVSRVSSVEEGLIVLSSVHLLAALLELPWSLSSVCLGEVNTPSSCSRGKQEGAVVALGQGLRLRLTFLSPFTVVIHLKMRKDVPGSRSFALPLCNNGYVTSWTFHSSLPGYTESIGDINAESPWFLKTKVSGCDQQGRQRTYWNRSVPQWSYTSSAYMRPWFHLQHQRSARRQAEIHQELVIFPSLLGDQNRKKNNTPCKLICTLQIKGYICS